MDCQATKRSKAMTVAFTRHLR